jgi:ABC-type dipeptide/oligopeptide/nickel transport system permease component
MGFLFYKNQKLFDFKHNFGAIFLQSIPEFWSILRS